MKRHSLIILMITLAGFVTWIYKINWVAGFVLGVISSIVISFLWKK